MKIRKRIITLGLVLGLVVNQIILYESKVIADDNVDTNGIPEFLLNDIKKETSNRNVNPVPPDSSSYQPIVQQRAHNTSVQYNNNITIEQQYPKRLPQQNSYTPYQNGPIGYDPNRPEWSEFCPYGLENAKKDDSFHLWATNSRYAADNQNYWVDRKKDFERHLAQCDSVQDQQARYGCYTKLRERQMCISANYVDPWTKAGIRQEKFRQSMGMWMMYDAAKNKNINVHHSGAVQQNYNVMWHNW